MGKSDCQNNLARFLDVRLCEGANCRIARERKPTLPFGGIQITVLSVSISIFIPNRQVGLQVRAGQVRGPGVDGRHLRNRVHIPGLRLHPKVLLVAGEKSIYLYI